jgi:hypothetical protein
VCRTLLIGEAGTDVRLRCARLPSPAAAADEADAANPAFAPARSDEDGLTAACKGRAGSAVALLGSGGAHSRGVQVAPAALLEPEDSEFEVVLRRGQSAPGPSAPGGAEGVQLEAELAECRAEAGDCPSRAPAENTECRAELEVLRVEAAACRAVAAEFRAEVAECRAEAAALGGKLEASVAAEEYLLRRLEKAEATGAELPEDLGWISDEVSALTAAAAADACAEARVRAGEAAMLGGWAKVCSGGLGFGCEEPEQACEFASAAEAEVATGGEVMVLRRSTAELAARAEASEKLADGLQWQLASWEAAAKEALAVVLAQVGFIRNRGSCINFFSLNENSGIVLFTSVLCLFGSI